MAPSNKLFVDMSDSEIEEQIEELKQEKINRAGLIKNIHVTGTEYQMRNRNDIVSASFQYKDSVGSDATSYNWDLFDKCKFHDRIFISCHCDANALIYEKAMIHMIQKGYRLTGTDGWKLIFEKN